MDLWVVEVLVVNVILNMFELTAIVVSNWDLSRVLIKDTVLELDKVTYAHGWMVCTWNFGTKIF